MDSYDDSLLIGIAMMIASVADDCLIKNRMSDTLLNLFKTEYTINLKIYLLKNFKQVFLLRLAAVID
jgi:hypothetical protein